ncbi:hypothetical protein HPB50_012532 [Hyalomma asiaticum]|uniref:Uncharacterized protein n=1 Tax=Hyalomma asiaticum TaxID=266040 RepID=A0ACB7S132_HYAAI|nr:hypothetical protein HPB50_012532 [Hyalomma asiaticum]
MALRRFSQLPCSRTTGNHTTTKFRSDSSRPALKRKLYRALGVNRLPNPPPEPTSTAGHSSDAADTLRQTGRTLTILSRPPKFTASTVVSRPMVGKRLSTPYYLHDVPTPDPAQRTTQYYLQHPSSSISPQQISAPRDLLRNLRDAAAVMAASHDTVPDTPVANSPTCTAPATHKEDEHGTSHFSAVLST